MQKLPIYLYTNLFEVTLDLDNNRGIHQIMYQRPLKIQKGVSNSIQLQFKNSDQKRLPIQGKSFKMNIFDSVERTLVLSKNINVLDTASTTTNALKGIGEVTFTEGDTLNIDSKSYNFSVVEIENDGTLSPAYSNTYYDVAGIIEIKDEIFPALVPSTSITDFQRTFNTATQKWEHSTGDIRRYPDKLSKGALHTASFYMTKFIGTVLVEGTLDNSPGINSNYATISTKVYNRFSGVDYVNFNGVFSSIRVRYIPGTNPVSGQNNDNVYAGTFDKLLLRS